MLSSCWLTRMSDLKPKLLIDADCLAYRAGFATDKTKYLVIYPDNGVCSSGAKLHDDAKSAKEDALRTEGTIWSRKECEPEDKAIMLVDIMLSDIRARYPGYKSVICLSGVGNFRHSISTRANYKGNRAGASQPTHLKAIRNHLILNHGALVSFHEEADDLLGILMTEHPGSVCCSIDKDLLQLPGIHYDFVKKEETTISPKEAVINFYSQVISGDTTDNIPGATGYGPIKARAALAGARSPWECWQAALGIYTREFGDISGPLFALECSRLVYVRRKEGELWDAPQATKKLQAA